MTLYYKPEILQKRMRNVALNISVLVLPFILSGLYVYTLILLFLVLIVFLKTQHWKKKGYITYDDSGLTIYGLFKKHVSWNDLKRMRYHISTISMYSDNKTYKIEKAYLNSRDLKRLEDEVKLRLPKS